MYPLWPVTDWITEGDEYVGDSALYWLRHPATGESWLWKTVKQETHGLQRVLGFDWSERVATEVAHRLNIPCSHVELAERQGQRGVVVLNFAPWGWQMSNGSLLLPNVVPGYSASRRGEVPGYTLDAVFEALDGSVAPDGSPENVRSGQEAFAGYLVLDALIGNRDRHHDNWAVLDDPNGQRWLAPAFDQASCLGYQERESRKIELLETRSVRQWVEVGRSRHFEGRPSLLELAVDAMQRVDPAARNAWADRLASISDDEWTPMLDAVPRHLLSQVDAKFAEEVLKVNRGRLLDALA